MNLVDLDPRWLKFVDTEHWGKCDTLAEADGISFLCPKCIRDPAVHHHSIVCWFRGKVPPEAYPSPGRWTPQGADFSDLSFVPGTPPIAHSVALQGGCNAHFLLDNGKISLV